MTQNDTNKQIENQTSGNSQITYFENDNILDNFDDVNSNINIFAKSEKLETQNKRMNREDSNFDLYDL